MSAALLLLALFSLSTSALWVRLADASIALIGSWRLLGAAVLLGVPVLYSGFRNLRWSGRAEAWASISAAIFFFLHLWTYVYSAQHTAISHLVIIFSAAPFFTAMGGLLFFREIFPRRLYAVCAFAAVGIFILFQDPIIAQTRGLQKAQFRGDLAALVSAFFHAGYALCGKKARESAPNLRFTFWLYALSGFLFAGLALAQEERSAELGPHFYLGIVGLIIFPTFLGHSLYAYLLKSVNINVLSCSKLLEPAFATGLAFLLFDEKVNLLTFVGFLLIGAALVILFNPLRALRKTQAPQN